MAVVDGNNSNNNKKKKSKRWQLGTEEWYEFVALCEKEKWHDRNHLPRLGDHDGVTLVHFMQKHGFSKGHVNRKFDDWQQLLKQDRAIGTLDGFKFSSHEDLFKLVMQQPGFRSMAVTSVDFSDPNAMRYDAVLNDTRVMDQLRLLRTEFVGGVNGFLATCGPREKDEEEQANKFRNQGNAVDPELHNNMRPDSCFS